MTKDEINALPDRVRRYIHDLETRCDPAGDVAALTLTRDQCRQLEASNAGLRAQLAEAERRLEEAREAYTLEARGMLLQPCKPAYYPARRAKVVEVLDRALAEPEEKSDV